MERQMDRVRAEILAAMGLGALLATGCGTGQLNTDGKDTADTADTGDTGDTGPVDNYGECDATVVDLAAPYEENEAGYPISGSEILYCQEDVEDMDACMACDDTCFQDVAAAWSADHVYDFSGFDMQRICGPMWLQSSCCHLVNLSEWVEGRPLRIQGHARTARLESREDWCTAGIPGEVPAALRPVLAAHFSQQALAEHASVASFARFLMQLMHLGAPPELLMATQQAIADELDHARRCFSIAAAYGEPVGPGPLDTRGAISESTPEEVLEETVREGCVNETLAAVEAALLAQKATDPLLKETFEVIASDEARHAGLAWKTVRWLVAQDPARLDTVRQVLETERSRLLSGVPGEGREDLEAFGILGPRARQALARQAFDTVITPIVASLTPGESRISS
jgi:hypothetical protein